MAEVPHRHLLELVSDGELQWLLHSGTGEIVQVPSAYGLRTLKLSAGGFGYLVAHKGDAEASSSSGVRRAIWARELLKTSLHQASSTSRQFVKLSDGTCRWKDELETEHQPWFHRCTMSDKSNVVLKARMRRIPRHHCFLYWELPWVVHFLHEEYQWNKHFFFRK